MLTTNPQSDNNNDSSENSLIHSNPNTSLDNQTPFLQFEIGAPVEPKVKPRKHFSVGFTTVMDKLNPLSYLSKLHNFSREKEDDNDLSTMQLEEEKQRRDSQLSGLNPDFDLDKDRQRLTKRKRNRKKYSNWLKIPGLLDNIAVDKLREWTGFRKSSHPGIDEDTQWQRPKGWRLVRAAVTIIIWCRRSLEGNAEKTGEIMKGKGPRQSKKKGRRFYISPKSKFKTVWDSFISLTMLYYAFVTPLRWSQGIFTSQWLLVDQILDMATWMDIFLSFITGIAMNKYLVKKRGQIAKRYLKTYFIFDIVSVVPLYLLNNGWYILKLIRLVHSKRAYNLLKRVAIAYPRGMSYLDFFKALFTFITTLNLLSAIWIYVGRIDVQQGSWILALDLTFSHDLYDAITLFLIAEMYVVDTVTTVGYGEVVPKKTLEMAVTMCYEFSGIIISALLQADFDYLINTNLLSYVKAENKKYEEWISMRLILREKFRPPEDQMESMTAEVKATLKDIKSYFRFVHSFAFRAMTYRNFFYKKMPAPLKMKLSHRTFEPLLEKFNSFFDHFDDNSFKYEICCRLRPEIFSNYDIICKEDSRPKGLYFILKGRALIWYKSARLFEVHEGFYFGDFLVLGMNCLLEMTAGYEQVYCLYISYKEIMEICSRHAEQTEIMQKVAFERLEIFNNTAAGKRKRTRNTSITIEIDEEEEDEITIFKDLPPDSIPNIDQNSVNKEDPTEIPKLKFEFEESTLSKRIARRSMSASVNAVASPSVKYAANIMQKHNEARSAGFKPRSSFRSQDDNEPKAPPSMTFGDSETDQDEKGIPDDSGSDSESDLDNSLEVPIEDAMLSFEDTRETEEICDYLQDRIRTMKYRLINLQNTYREEVLLEWKHLKILVRKMNSK